MLEFMTRATVMASVALIGITSVVSCAPKDNTKQTVDAPVISAADIGKRIEVLASDEFEGRAPGTKGGEKSTQYIADEMQAAGLVPMGVDGTYFQPITLTETTVQDSSFMRITKADGTEIPTMYKDNSIYWTKQYRDSVSLADSEMVFVGYGTVAPEYNWNDYEGLDVSGKTVVMLVNDPGFATKDKELFNGSAMTYYGRWTYKYEEAARQGAAAAIIIHETEPASYGWKVVADSWSGPQIDLVRPDEGMSRAKLEGWVSIDAANDIFTAAGLDLAALKAEAAKSGFKPVPMPGLSLSAQIDNDIKTVKSRNVIGGVKGSKYPDEYVLYMAHWDHLGAKDGAAGEDHIHNGAVDNATGTSVILEVGEAFAEGPAPERSIMVLAVTAEESGLLGSAYFAEAPTVPLKNIVAGINIDALYPVGRTKDVIVIGYGASELDDLMAKHLKPRGMYITPDPRPEAGFFYRSDHISLAKKGVPMMYAKNGNDHEVQGKEYGEAFAATYGKERYHAPSDEYDHTWDLTGFKQIGEIYYDLGAAIANSRDWPNWYEGAEFRALRDEMRKDAK